MKDPLHPIEASPLHARRELVFLIVSGLFLGSLTMLNVLGLTRFIDLSFTVMGVDVPMPLAVGVLPYPITFLCTDIISELYGRKRASNVVWVGFGLNIWVAFILWLGGVLPPELPIDAATGLPPEGTDGRLFFQVQHLAFGSVVASMGAYLLAQLCDVHLFHFWKRLTGGAHLWLRNNASTIAAGVAKRNRDASPPSAPTHSEHCCCERRRSDSSDHCAASGPSLRRQTTKNRSTQSPLLPRQRGDHGQERQGYSG